MPTSSASTHRCIAEAALLVRNNVGAAERLLITHHPRDDGRCHGCGSHLVHWPCVIVAIARRAQELRAGETDRGVGFIVEDQKAATPVDGWIP